MGAACDQCDPVAIRVGALLMPGFIALPILAASFAAMLLVDLFMVRIGSLPEWYGNLRVILSAVVVASLLLRGYRMILQKGAEIILAPFAFDCGIS